MDRKRALLAFSCLLLMNGPCLAEQRATTEDGRPVVLKEDGTWKYAEIFPLPQENLVPPKILKKTTPVYTEAAIVAGIEGKVVLQCVFRRTGQVENCTVRRGLEHGLTERAVAEITTNWRFEPARLGTQAVDAEAFIEIDFILPAGSR